MSIFKCKMCGGDLRVDQENGVAVCEYCGTRQTLPRFSGGRSGDLYARAGDYRRGNEFDKAAALYEQMLAEDGGDAELYWSLVLCRYGIEYVEDPADHRRVPTINRTQFKSILEDKDYRAALEHATPAQRRLYETEAQAIERLQRSILAISQREEPFDVFICYKESDEQGRRTMDSVLAMELYKELTRDGVKTFFSRVTLEDKLGVAYEPYIFAALQSARVMVVISTRQAYVNAVWVKNEWNRYLALIRSGEKKTLIPAYRDMSPYDLPEEFRYLQAQDLGRVGAMQDLVYGVEKLLKADPRHMPAPAAAVASSPVSGLLERAFLFLEDGEWASADEYCEKVLDAEPRNAEAYLGKLMVERKIRLRTQLSQQEEPFDGSDFYRKAMRFGSDELRAELTGCIDAIHTRRENERLAAIYRDLTAELERADSEAAYRSLAQRFAEIGGYQDAVAQQELCLKKAEDSRKRVIYNAALRLMTGRDPENYRRAMEQLEPIADWEDAAELIQRCRQNIDDIAAEEERKRLERERKEEERRIVHLDGLYAAALAAMEGAKNEAGYKSAAGKFDGICGYRDATQQRDRCLKKAEECRHEGVYQSAKKQMNKGGMAAYRRAMATFQSITGYRDADEQAIQCQEQLRLLEEAQAAAAEAVKAAKAEKKTKKKQGGALMGILIALLIMALLAGAIYLGSGKNVGNALELLPVKVTMTRIEEDGEVDCGVTIQDVECRVEGANAIFRLTFELADDRPINYFAFSPPDGEVFGVRGTITAEVPSVDILIPAAKLLAADAMTVSMVPEDSTGDRYVNFWVVEGFETLKNKIERYLEAQSELAETEDELPTLESTINPGDTVTFGHYEQDNDTTNGPEAIQWRVLDVQNGKALIISEKVLARGLHRSTVWNGHDYTTWETSLIRSWMNDDFYDVAFTDTEKEAIQLTDVKDEANPYMDDIITRPNVYHWSAMEPGVDTQDYVFALSINEFKKYFPNPESAKAEATEVAKVGNPYGKDERLRKAIYTSADMALELDFDWITMDGVSWSWWLRTVGPKHFAPGNFLSIVLGDGSLLEEGDVADSCDIGIRPAMWVDAKMLSSTLNPGSIYTFGHYEQDYDTSNGAEAIPWKVLDVQNGKALLLSQDVLVRLQYHPQESGATWKDCTLRQWLNDDFYHAAFSEEELKRVCLTRNVNEDNPTYGTDGGEDTDDHVFLLSLSEAEKYFASDEERQCEFSAAVNLIVDQEPSVQKGIFETEDPYGYDRRWWLRTPGMYPLTTVIIEKDGSISRNGNTGAYASGVACHQWNGVRPAIWIEID